MEEPGPGPSRGATRLPPGLFSVSDRGSVEEADVQLLQIMEASPLLVAAGLIPQGLTSCDVVMVTCLLELLLLQQHRRGQRVKNRLCYVQKPVNDYFIGQLLFND